MNALSANPRWNTVRNLLGQLSEDEQQFDQLLASQRKWLAEAQVRQQKQTHILQRLERQNQQLAQNQQSADQLLAAEQARAAALEQDLAAARDQLVSKDKELGQLHKELSQLRAQKDQSESQCRELAQEREHLQEELERVSGRLAEASEKVQALELHQATEHGNQQQLQERFRREHQDLLDAREDAVRLEDLLEKRMAETKRLRDELAEARERANEERAEWTTELKLLRRALEVSNDDREEYTARPRSAARMPAAETEAAGAASASATKTPESRKPKRTSDPVLDAVRAQFEKLQANILGE